jgi:hypothetical protein
MVGKRWSEELSVLTVAGHLLVSGPLKFANEGLGVSH